MNFIDVFFLLWFGNLVVLFLSHNLHPSSNITKKERQKQQQQRVGLFYLSIRLLWWVSDPMTCLCVYLDFTVAFVGNYLSFPWSPVRSRSFLWVPVRSCAFSMHTNWPMLFMFCKYCAFMCVQYGLHWRFANPVRYQWTESTFSRNLIFLWVFYVLIAMSLSGICYSLEFALVGC